jgi:excisionase family DNA binding protein
MPRIAQLPPLNRNERRAATKATREHNDGRPVLTVNEAAAYLKVSRRTVYRMIHSGRLRSIQIPGGTRLRPGDLDAYLDAHVAS